MAMTLLTNL